MAKAPAIKALDEGDEPLPLTSITDKLVSLPDESVIEVEVPEGPALVASEEEDEGTAAPPPKTPAAEPVDDGSQETLEALRKRVSEQDAASRERVRIAEQNAENERQQRLRSEQQHREQQQATQDESAQRELALITQNLEASSSQLETLGEELARQNEAGEFKAAAATQVKISKLAAQVDRLETEKATFEANIGQRRAPTHEGAVQPPGARVEQRQEIPATTGARLEQWLATLDPPAAKWIREHPDCAPPNLGGTESGYKKMMAGHWAAQAANVETNSPEYFKKIEESVGLRQAEPLPGEQRQQQRRQQPPGARRAIPSAPPSREVPGNAPTPGRSRQVRLNKDQQEHALLAFPHLAPKDALAAYARNLVELEAEGKMGRTNV